MPNLRDPNFAETVVLMLEHNADGAVGLVLNRPYPGDPHTVCSGLAVSWLDEGHGDIRLGGPVRTQAGCIVHPPGHKFEDTQIVTPDIAVSTSREALETLVQDGECPFRLMLGYAGWGPGQLERELAEGTWIHSPASHGLIFSTNPELIYDQALALLGINRRDLVGTPTAIH